MKSSLLTLLFMPILLTLNMASPVTQGTLGSQPFINKYVDVLHENIHITIDESFEYADFEIEYHIEASQSGVEIPFLFYASEYTNDFKVSIDGESIELLKVKDLFSSVEKEKFKNFPSLFDHKAKEVEYGDYGKNENELNINDFLYFKTNIFNGKHIIKVSYKATCWVEKGEWLKTYSFRYALAPAKYWKSFGRLNITINAQNFKNSITSNLGNPAKGSINEIATWEFNKIPSEMFTVNYKPKANSLAQTIIKAKPFNISLIISALLVLFHFKKIYKYRKTNSKALVSPITIIGGVLIPLFFVFSIIGLGLVIDYLLGEYASGQASYGYFSFMFTLPYYLIGYLLISIIVDFSLKKILLKT